MLQNKQPAFIDIVAKLLKHSGFPISSKIEIKYNEYTAFWENLSEDNNVAYYVIELLKMIDHTEHNKKVKNYNLESLLSSLLTMCMFRNLSNVKKQRDYKEVKSNWEHHFQGKNKQLLNPYSNAIVTNLMQMFENQQQEENNFYGYLICSIAFLPELYKVAKPENIELMYDSLKQHYSLVEQYGKQVRIKNDSFYNFLLDERFDLQETAEFQFCYEYLTLQIRSKKNLAPRIYHDSISKFFKMIPFIAQDFPEQAEKAALSLLHMTKQFITFYNFENQDPLKSLLNIIEIFRRWPFPVGVLANELVQLLSLESKSRWSAFRAKIREEIPAIDFYDPPAPPLQNFQEMQIPLSSQQNQQMFEPRMPQVYVFQDNRVSEASNVIMFACQSEKRNPTPHDFRYFICTQLIQQYKPPNEKLSYSTLNNLSEADVFKLYCQLMTIIQKCERIESVPEFELIYQNALEEILANVKTEQGQQQLLIPDFPSYYFHIMTKKPIVFTAPKQAPIKIEQNQCADIQSIKDFIQRAYDINMPLHNEPLRLLIVGGDQELFQVCMLLGEIYKATPIRLKNLDIRVYICPNSNSAMSQFLAVKDPWYQRYLYLPFVEDILIPKLENIKEDQKQEPEKDNKFLQLELKAMCLNTYLREANRAYNVRVYKLKIWQKDLSKDGVAIQQQMQGLEPKPDKDLINSRLFFCSYVMFGAIADFEQVKERTKDEKTQRMSFYDYKEKNLCKFQNLWVKMKAACTDMLGNISDCETSAFIHNCKINNIYTNFFEGNMPMPHTDWLEMSYITQDNAKLFDSGLRQKKIFKKHSQESIQNAFKSLFTNISITKLLVEEINKKPFSIIVDGNIYTDVVQFKISSTRPNKEFREKYKNRIPQNIMNLNLPIMSFLPFKV
ncbi:hypothetical protein pb186bvf_002560 [Paramecium bursaria]